MSVSVVAELNGLTHECEYAFEHCNIHEFECFVFAQKKLNKYAKIFWFGTQRNKLFFFSRE